MGKNAEESKKNSVNNRLASEVEVLEVFIVEVCEE